MIKKRRPYLDFYGEHAVSPVLNAIDLEVHANQRSALYFSLGLSPNCIKGKRILEFGPGNGINSLFTMSMQPKEYVLVDANPTGVMNCYDNFNRYYPGKKWEVVDSLIENFKTDKKFDLVICEGLLPNQVSPSQMAKHCASFLDTGGLFVLTCHDMISTVSETLRCLPGMLLVKEVGDFDERVLLLSNFYKSHLGHLKGMTRTTEDWVIDNVLNVEFWNDAPLFSIAEAIKVLEDDFVVSGASPAFFQNWEWYKNFTGDVKGRFNCQWKESFWKNSHNFIDWRINTPQRSIEENLLMYEVCKQIRYKIGLAAVDNSNIGDLVEACMQLSSVLPDEYSPTKLALRSYISGLKIYMSNGEIRPEEFEGFGSWWGRGMQYMSFLKV